jgi:hypothetical protein
VIKQVGLREGGKKRARAYFKNTGIYEVLLY